MKRFVLVQCPRIFKADSTQRIDSISTGHSCTLLKIVTSADFTIASSYLSKLLSARPKTPIDKQASYLLIFLYSSKPKASQYILLAGIGRRICFVLKSRNSSHKWQIYQICTNFFYDATPFPLAKRFFTLLLISIHIM